MLNALRHQRFGTDCWPWCLYNFGQCSTPYGIRGLARNRVESRQRRRSCSTPYGIRGLAHPDGVIVGAMVRECSTPYGIRGLAPSFDAAFHRRWAVCSTPYGIRGLARLSVLALIAAIPGAQRLTASEVWHFDDYNTPKRTPNVLNALRHQRFGTGSIKVSSITKILGCSTPYGIRGLALHGF